MTDVVPAVCALPVVADAAIAAARAAGGHPLVLDWQAGLRLPVSFLAGAEVVQGGWRFAGLDRTATLALALIGLNAPAGLDLDDGLRSFLAEPPLRAVALEDGSLVVTLLVGTPPGPRIELDLAHAWIQSLAPARLTVDLGSISHLTSVVIAWLLQLAQGARPAPVRVVRAVPVVKTQLRQLRLDTLLALE